MVNSKQECLHYTYLDLSKFNQLDGAAATRPDGEEVLLETNRDILIPLKFPDLVLVKNISLTFLLLKRNCFFFI